MGMLLEATLPRPGTRIAQLSLDFLSPVSLTPMRVTTEVLRPGKKIELLAAAASIAGRTVLRATAWRLAVEDGRSPAVNVVEPPPAFSETEDRLLLPDSKTFGYALALEWRFAEGAFDALGPATAWSRLRVAVVDGEPVTPLARALAMVDSANGISGELDPRAYLFVPVNLTVSLTRSPDGDWVGMQAQTAIDRDGVGTTHARLFDPRGNIGRALQTLFVEPRRG
jgi:hypothetical protein